MKAKAWGLLMWLSDNKDRIPDDIREDLNECVRLRAMVEQNIGPLVQDGDRPILDLDFDGTIHEFKQGWQGANVVSGPPIDGSLEFVERAMQFFRVAIRSSRT